MTFSAEVVMATSYVLNMVDGRRTEIGPTPAWCNFRFFGEIRPGKLNHVIRYTPKDKGSYGCYGWWVAREVEFFYRGKLVAVVGLQGYKVDRKRYEDDKTMWAISHFQYAALFDGRPEPKDWQERYLPITSLCSAA